MTNFKKLKTLLPLTIELKSDHIIIIDQTLLPSKLKFIKIKTYKEAIKAIKDMKIRGAQALGALGAGGIFLAANNYNGKDIVAMLNGLAVAAREIIAARPTAINLAWSVNQILSVIEPVSVVAVKKQIKTAYQELLESEVVKNIKIGEYGANLIKDGMNIETHCNAGSLSAIWLGTATAPMYTAMLAGKKIKVLVDETRPWLQGSRLTAWELDKAGIDYQINIDSASPYLMSHGLVDMVIVGADHIASNGDTANKIGTYALALAAKAHKIPFYIAAVSGTIDMSIKNGAAIKIEERAGGEIISDIKYKGAAISPKKAKTINPVFDVTPAKYITGFITEFGIISPADFKKHLKF
ncbi:MAG: S-methyl-5-thioribose-1-phosphate isomerase [Candidatus Falkowbacteria bacterium]